jgi:hypothetical protein
MLLTATALATQITCSNNPCDEAHPCGFLAGDAANGVSDTSDDDRLFGFADANIEAGDAGATRDGTVEANAPDGSPEADADDSSDGAESV